MTNCVQLYFMSVLPFFMVDRRPSLFLLGLVYKICNGSVIIILYVYLKYFVPGWYGMARKK